LAFTLALVAPAAAHGAAALSYRKLVWYFQ
jgi:hypothetical protein